MDFILILDANIIELRFQGFITNNTRKHKIK